MANIGSDLYRKYDALATACLPFRRMPDMPFCDAPIPPPALPAPPPCGELGPPPPPPPNPPALLQRKEHPPPPLPAPPPMYYDLPPPPTVFTPHSNSKIPPLPCLPEKNGEVSMAKCTNDNNENNAMGVLQLPRTAGTEYYEVKGYLSWRPERDLCGYASPAASSHRKMPGWSSDE